MKKVIAALGMLTLLIGGVNAQTKKEKKAEMMEKINEAKKEFLKEELGFTDDKMNAVWDVYLKRENDRKALKKQTKPKKVEDWNLLTDAEAEQMITESYKNKSAMLELDQSYIDKFMNVMTAKEYLLMGKAEKEFKKELLKKLKQEAKEEHSHGHGNHDGHQH